MKILFIDYISNGGHIVYNRIQLKSIIGNGENTVDLVCRGDRSLYIPIPVNEIFQVPESIFKKGRVNFRLSLIRAQFYIGRHIDFTLYDAVIFSSYDALTFWMMPHIRTRVFVVNHNNVARYENCFERCCAKLIPYKYTHIALNERMYSKLIQFGFSNVQVIPHGFEILPKAIDMPCLFFEKNEFYKVVFCPSETSSDSFFFEQLMYSVGFNEYLKKNNILFVLKNQQKIETKNNILVLNKWLTTEEYHSLFTNSDLICCAYHEYFKYRVSGVMFECIAKDKLCILNRSNDFECYSDIFNYNPFFNKDVSSFIDKLEYIFHLDTQLYYNSKSILQPNWSEIIDKFTTN